MTETPLEMWWPTPEALEDLVIEDAEEGFTLSAPDDTECSKWLAYWSQDEEHHEVFNNAFTDVLTNYLNTFDLEHGKTEAIPDEQSGHRVETEENTAGPLS